MAKAGSDRDTKVLQTQNKAQAPAPACGPSTTMPASTRRLDGRPQAMSLLASSPRRSSQGLTMPQDQKVASIAMLIQKSPVAACAAVCPATFCIQGPAHSVCMATMPP